MNRPTSRTRNYANRIRARVRAPQHPRAPEPESILIADDDERIRTLLRWTLAHTRLRVREAATGDQAWTALQEQAPAVAVIDQRMPGLSGREVIEEALRDSRLANTTLVLLTAAPNEVADLLDHPRVEVMVKPFSPTRLLDVVGRRTGRKVA